MSNISVRFLTLFIATAISFCQPVEAGKVKVFLLGGHSNATGGGDPNGLPPELALQEDVWIWLERKEGGPDWVALGPGHGGRTHRPDWPDIIGLNPDGAFGPELTIGRYLADTFPDDQIVLVKHAGGGSDVDSDWNPENPGPLGQWQHMWSSLLAKTDNAFQSLTDMGLEYKVSGMFWTQGVRDAINLSWDSNDPIEFEAGRVEAFLRAGRYQENLTRLIDAVRDEYGDSQLPFIIAQEHSNIPTCCGSPLVFPALDVVREAQEATALALNNVVMFQTDDLPTSDGAHWTAEGQLEHGRRHVNAYLTIVPEPTTVAMSFSGALLLMGFARRRLKRA